MTITAAPLCVCLPLVEHRIDTWHCAKQGRSHSWIRRVWPLRSRRSQESREMVKWTRNGMQCYGTSIKIYSCPYVCFRCVPSPFFKQWTKPWKCIQGPPQPSVSCNLQGMSTVYKNLIFSYKTTWWTVLTFPTQKALEAWLCQWILIHKYYAHGLSKLIHSPNRYNLTSLERKILVHTWLGFSSSSCLTPSFSSSLSLPLLTPSLFPLLFFAGSGQHDNT